MSFDLQRFSQALLSPRQAEVAVPDLAPWFGPDEPPAWTVRGLTGDDIARASEAADKAAKIRAAVESLLAAGEGRREAFAAILGVGDDVPDDLIKRYEHLMAGSVEPKCDRELAIKLFATFPFVAYLLTNKILELTGLGADSGKVLGSGPTPESEPL